MTECNLDTFSFPQINFIQVLFYSEKLFTLGYNLRDGYLKATGGASRS